MHSCWEKASDDARKERAFHVATDALAGLVNQDERPFTPQERADLNEALESLRKHMRSLDMLNSMTLGIATVAGFGMGVIFARVMT